jgi:ketosteroid isomerase-like protein
VAGQSKSGPPAKASQKGDDAAVEKLTSDFADAMSRGDFKAAAAMWDTNGLYFAIDGTKCAGPGEVEQALSHLSGVKIALKTSNVHWLDPTVAVVQGTWQVSGQDVNPPDHGEYMAVIKKVGRDWKYAEVRPWVPASM